MKFLVLYSLLARFLFKFERLRISACELGHVCVDFGHNCLDNFSINTALYNTHELVNLATLLVDADLNQRSLLSVSQASVVRSLLVAVLLSVSEAGVWILDQPN